MQLPAPTRASMKCNNLTGQPGKCPVTIKRVWIAQEITLEAWLMGRAITSASQRAFGAPWQIFCASPPKPNGGST